MIHRLNLLTTYGRTPNKSLLARHWFRQMNKGWLPLLFELHCSFYFCWVAIFQLPGFFSLGFYAFLYQCFPSWILELLTTQSQQSLSEILPFLPWVAAVYVLSHGSSWQLSSFLRNLSQGCLGFSGCSKTRPCTTAIWTPGRRVTYMLHLYRFNLVGNHPKLVEDSQLYY